MDSKFLYTRIRIFQPPKLKILIKAYKKKKSDLYRYIVPAVDKDCGLPVL